MTSSPPEWLPSKRLTKSVDEDLEQLKSSNIAGRNVKMVQPHWETIWQFLKKLSIDLIYDPAIPLLSIYQKEKEIYVHTESGTQMFRIAYSQ